MFQDLLELKNALLIEQSLRFFYEKLDINEEEQKKITIKLVSRLGSSSGDCMGNYDSNGKLLSININVKHYGSPYGIVHVIAHELIHAKQHLRGDFGKAKKLIPFFSLFAFEVEEPTYKGVPYKNTPYYEREHEQEAFELSDGIYLEFLSSLRKTSTESNESHNINNGE